MKIIQSSTQKSGHSVMTTLPPDVLEKLDMSAGDHIEYVIKENGDGFLGDFFIRKAMWSTPVTIKSTAASIKKFYKSMLDHGHVDKESYLILCDDIKENMSDWQAECEDYNNSDDLDW